MADLAQNLVIFRRGDVYVETWMTPAGSVFLTGVSHQLALHPSRFLVFGQVLPCNPQTGEVAGFRDILQYHRALQENPQLGQTRDTALLVEEVAGVPAAAPDPAAPGLGGPAQPGVAAPAARGGAAGTVGGGAFVPAAAAAAASTSDEERWLALLSSCQDSLNESISIMEPYKLCMTPVKVFLPYGLADHLGAEMATSRWRVCLILCGQLFIFAAGLGVLAGYLDVGWGW